MNIVTGGSAYTDIDVLACGAAHAQLLRLLGKQADAVLTAPWNQTIPSPIRMWDIQITPTYLQQRNKDCSYILVDVSDPKHFAPFVDLEQVVEVFDHHHGFKHYWEEKLGQKAHIDSVGACATLIWESFKAHQAEHLIETVNANLLYTAIFANTLDYKSSVTTARDIKAGKELESHVDLPDNWKSIYYQSVEDNFLCHLQDNIQKDTKTVSLFGRTLLLGQLEIWNAHTYLMGAHKDLFFEKLKTDVLEGRNEFMLNVVSIEEGVNYIICNSPFFQDKLLQMMEAKNINEHTLVTSKLWLRKEILKMFATTAFDKPFLHTV